MYSSIIQPEYRIEEYMYSSLIQPEYRIEEYIVLYYNQNTRLGV